MPSLEQEVPFKKATFGMGCFWANDALFGSQPGVLRTRVGYSGGTTPNPVYKSIDSASSEDGAAAKPPTENPRGDHTEVIEIDYDPKVITYHDLLQLFWNNHEYGLTTVIKRQYMSLILYHDEDQKRIAEKEIKIEAGKRNEKLLTELAPAGPFYPAEDYHQKYRLQKHGWIVEELNLTPELLQTSEVAAKLNGYIAGVGTQDQFEKDIKRLAVPEKIASFVKIHLLENAGGSLYC
ncbi:peptide methionine sulfoxide reductase isoform X3 [Sitophilus oryzae]|nr:peptide methionine sulfoxide reductase isoform X3 [Sitophilus oryzae]XP_030763938.1 peptide methionine sulfoxide reductase isoform X3 [Sitophilus oryzae]XP_030763939.1 peptide methionine sulfoxide reductase isoform X3 [Sitophilus oryzae]XP_030763940.1 peptide methionine sulfoxide reductase isoform X3 [Sitophilus oryzae]